jgi:hypothetical protein
LRYWQAPAWSQAATPGRNGRIAFTRFTSSSFVARDRSAVARPSDCGPAQPGSIWTVASNGRGLRHIGPPDPSGPIWASWSPRGRQVAIESVNSDCAYSGSIDIFDPNGHALSGGILTDRLDSEEPVLLGWVSERRLLLLLYASGFITNPAQAGMWETTLDGTPVRLMYGATDIVDAAASARGAIVFAHSGSSGDIRLLLAQGRSVHLVYGDRPDWAPDARRLVFQRGGDLWIIDSRARRVRRLTRTRA